MKRQRTRRYRQLFGHGARREPTGPGNNQGAKRPQALGLRQGGQSPQRSGFVQSRRVEGGVIPYCGGQK